MIQFYAPYIEKDSVLPEEESMHCCRVLRKKVGDEIFVTDGKGCRYVCEITKASPVATEVKIINCSVGLRERNYSITLAVAPTKNSDRMEWMIEKAVELGVDRVSLLRCDRSERKIMKLARIQKIMVSALKQSLDTYIPSLEEIIDFKDFVSRRVNNVQKFFGYCSDEFERKLFAREYTPFCDVEIMIGPEGDFSPEEVKLAIENDFIPVSFGEKRLRTETAGVFAVSAVHTINQRLK